MADKAKIINSSISVQNKVALLTICTAQEIQNKVQALLKKYDISFSQLTILHILDEAPNEKMTVNQIKQYMVDESPNVSRSLNKLASKGLVSKNRSVSDQRVVYISITENGKNFHTDCDQRLFGENLLDLPDGESKKMVDMLMRI
jgi:MarR family transcriptional regulator